MNAAAVSPEKLYEREMSRLLGTYCFSPNTWPASSFHASSKYGRIVGEGMLQAEYALAEDLIEQLTRDGVEGAVVEFGVFEGRWLERLVAIVDRLGEHREFYGFDSFEGLPEPSEADEGLGWERGEYAADFNSVAGRLRCAERPEIRLLKGWFSDTVVLPEAQAVGAVAYARIDGDLYESAVDSLAWLSGRLSEGAILVFDDWTFDLAKGETRAFYEWAPTSGYRFEPLGFVGIGGFYFRVTRAQAPLVDAAGAIRVDRPTLPARIRAALTRLGLPTFRGRRP